MLLGKEAADLYTRDLVVYHTWRPLRGAAPHARLPSPKASLSTTTNVMPFFDMLTTRSCFSSFFSSSPQLLRLIRSINHAMGRSDKLFFLQGEKEEEDDPSLHGNYTKFNVVLCCALSRISNARMRLNDWAPRPFKHLSSGRVLFFKRCMSVDLHLFPYPSASRRNKTFQRII